MQTTNRLQVRELLKLQLELLQKTAETLSYESIKESRKHHWEFKRLHKVILQEQLNLITLLKRMRDITQPKVEQQNQGTITKETTA